MWHTGRSLEYEFDTDGMCVSILLSGAFSEWIYLDLDNDQEDAL